MKIFATRIVIRNSATRGIARSAWNEIRRGDDGGQDEDADDHVTAGFPQTPSADQVEDQEDLQDERQLKHEHGEQQELEDHEDVLAVVQQDPDVGRMNPEPLRNCRDSGMTWKYP